MEICVWPMVFMNILEEWKCTGIHNGGLFVMMAGMNLMLKLFADSSIIYQYQYRF
jgi:hypothetical protein